MGKLVLHFTLSTHRLQNAKGDSDVVGFSDVVGLYEPLELLELQSGDDESTAYHMRGKEQMTGNLHFISQLHDKAFEFYRKRIFRLAAETFEEAAEWCKSNPKMNVSPKAALVLKKRCLQFASRPPPKDWQFTSLEQYSRKKVKMKHDKS